MKFSADGRITEIRVRRTKNPKAKPRLSVALDYADLLGREDDGPGPVFSRFEQLARGGPFQVEVNPKMGLPKTQWIKDIRIHVRDRGSIRRLNTDFSVDEQGSYRLTVHDEIALGKIAKKRRRFYYIEIWFSADIRNHERFSVYETSDCWVWQCEFIDRQAEALEEFHRSLALVPGPVPPKVIKMRKDEIRDRVSGMRVQRNRRFGEIPDLPYYSAYFGKEYAFPWVDSNARAKGRRK